MSRRTNKFWYTTGNYTAVEHEQTTATHITQTNLKNHNVASENQVAEAQTQYSSF